MIDKKLLLELQKLKSLPRAGWVRQGVQYPESVAAHSWGMVMLVIELQPIYAPEIDILRAIKIAAVHDVPEIRAGDITPYDQVNEEAKYEKEEAAAIAIFGEGSTSLGYWREFEQCQTPEAKFVKAIDKLDMALQARSYMQHGQLSGQQAGEFLESAKGSMIKVGYGQLWEHYEKVTAD